MPLLECDEKIKEILRNQRRVAVIGISDNPSRPSYFVSKVLKNYGFKLFFVNPKYKGQIILGEPVYHSLLEIPDKIDIINIYRRPIDIPYIYINAVKKGFKTFWFQPGTFNPKISDKLIKKEYNVVKDRCMKIEVMRLLEV